MILILVHTFRTYLHTISCGRWLWRKATDNTISQRLGITHFAQEYRTVVWVFFGVDIFFINPKMLIRFFHTLIVLFNIFCIDY